MNFRFANTKMRRAYEKQSDAGRRWGPIIGKAYIARVNQIKAAGDLSDLSQGPGKFEELTQDRKGEYSFRLTKGWRLEMTLEDNDTTVVIHRVSDHYEP